MRVKLEERKGQGATKVEYLLPISQAIVPGDVERQRSEWMAGMAGRQESGDLLAVIGRVAYQYDKFRTCARR